jgi:outer membrane protein W
LGFEAYWANIQHYNSSQFKKTNAPIGIFKVWLSDYLAVEAGGTYFEQDVKDDFLFKGSLNATMFFAGAQLRLDKGQRFVPYVGGGGVLMRTTGVIVDQNVTPCSSTPGSFTYCTEDIEPTARGNYFNAGLTTYLTQNRNWELSVDYRRINIDLKSKLSVNTFPGLGTPLVDNFEGKVNMDMQWFNIGLGYHFQ